MTTILPDGRNTLSADSTSQNGWVIEAIIDARLAWLVQPVPLEPYSFTFDLERAHVLDERHKADTTRSCVWCGLNSRGANPTLTVVQMTDAYRARVAAETSPHQPAPPSA